MVESKEKSDEGLPSFSVMYQVKLAESVISSMKFAESGQEKMFHMLLDS